MSFLIGIRDQLAIPASPQPAVAAAGTQPVPVTEVCLGCICEAVSQCDANSKCDGDVCGLFKITWAYWADSGKPTVNGEAPTSTTAYSNCANDPYCAARAVQGYMAKFGQDCNRDGAIDCLDYAAIHRHGGYGCSAPLPPDYNNRFQQCLKQVGAI